MSLLINCGARRQQDESSFNITSSDLHRMRIWRWVEYLHIQCPLAHILNKNNEVWWPVDVTKLIILLQNGLSFDWSFYRIVEQYFMR